MTDAPAALGRLMLAFDGLELPDAMRTRLRGAPAAGVTLFRYRNVGSPDQVRALTDAIQACAPPGRPFLVAIDQEGGQLRGLGSGSTPFPGAMALGAADDPSLTRRVGTAIGRELRACGVNVNYAPVADLATNPANPSLGVRSFGDRPARVAEHVAAFVEGSRRAGVAATLKHFPGKGDAGVDTHHVLARIERTRAQLDERELAPFRAGLGAGAGVVMSGHFAIPAITGDRPATLSPAVMVDLLRGELGFEGVTISDAFDMDALSAGEGRLGDAIDGLNGGLDLLLLGGRSERTAFDTHIAAAGADGRLDPAATALALDRITALRHALASTDAPELSCVGGEEHQALARAVAEAAVTLVRDRDGLVPLRLSPDDRLLVVVPGPADLTPADTSAAEPLGLAETFRRRHAGVEELVVDHRPTRGQIARAVERAHAASVVVVGTVSASLEPAQAHLVRSILAARRPTVTAALRTPWDLGAYAEAGTHLCAYSVVAPSLEALAAVCFGEIPARGRLPVVS